LQKIPKSKLKNAKPIHFSWNVENLINAYEALSEEDKKHFKNKFLKVLKLVKNEEENKEIN